MGLKKYLSMDLELQELIADGLGDSDEADALRLVLDEVWKRLSAKEMKVLRSKQRRTKNRWRGRDDE